MFCLIVGPNGVVENITPLSISAPDRPYAGPKVRPRPAAAKNTSQSEHAQEDTGKNNTRRS